MADRMIKNISRLQHALPVHVKGDVMGMDIVVQLSSGEVFWCPDNRDTKSLLVYVKKGFLQLEDSNKPSEAKYYEAYPEQHWSSQESRPEMVAEPSATTSSNEEEASQKLKWEDDEITYLKRVYPKKGVTHCAEKLGRSKGSVKKKIEALGLKREKLDDKE